MVANGNLWSRKDSTKASPPQKSNLKSPVAKEVEKLRNNGHTDKDIKDKLIESDGFTINNTETISKIPIRSTITLAPNSLTNHVPSLKAPTPVNRIAEPIWNEKPQKLWKSSQKINSENSGTENVVDLDKSYNKQINQQIAILENIELLKKGNIACLFFSKHLKDF